MRRSVLVYTSVAIGVLTLAMGLTWLDSQKTIKRYHQHQEQLSEVQLGPCTVCGGKGELCTHLPILSLDTGGKKIPGRPIPNESGHLSGYETGENGEEEIVVSLSTVDKDGVWHHENDPLSHTSQALLRVRGNTSAWFDKANYKIELVQDNLSDVENSLPLLGMSSGSEWALHGPFLDKTLMRNYLCMNISAEIMGYAPNVRFCEVLLDGQYQGVYLLTEAITVQEGRVPLTKYQDGDQLFSYLVRLDYNVNPEKMINNFTSYTYRLEANSNLELLYPGRLRQTESVKNYVSTDFSEIEKSIFSLEIFQGSEAYKDSIDVDSFVDYYILQEFLCITDTYSGSTYFYRDVRGQLTAGPVWDYNNAFDNYAKSLPMNRFLLSEHGWFSRLLMDEEFVEKVIRRYKQLRLNILSEKRLKDYVSDVDSWLGSAVDRNFEVWGYSFDPDQLTDRTRRSPYSYEELTIYDLNPSSHDEAMEQLSDFMIKRARWLDNNIEALRQYSHYSRNAQHGLD